MNRLAQRSLRFANSAFAASVDAAVTIAARAPGLMTQGFDPTGEKARESQRMIHEKVAAACEGAFGAQMAWGMFLLRASFGGVHTANDFSHGLADVAEAAMAPGHEAVRANARRLTGRGRRH